MRRRTAGLCVLGLFFGSPGCTDDLLPGEQVLGAEIPMEIRYGQPDDLLGWSVVWESGSGWAAAAPGGGYVRFEPDLSGEPVEIEGPARWVGLREGVRFVGSPEGVTRDGEPWWSEAPITGMAVGPYVYVTTETTLFALDEDGTAAWSAPARGGRGFGIGVERVLVALCGARCEVRAWSHDGVSMGKILEAGRHGAIGEHEGVAWAADPMWEDDLGRGQICAEDGRCVEGEPGDHLGVGLGGGYVSGVFNRHLTPQRTRIVPLEGGETLVLEVGAERQVVNLAGDADTLIIGDPHHPHGGLTSGAVMQVEVAEIAEAAARATSP